MRDDEKALAEAPMHVISLGAGVQSSVMALMAATGELTPMPSCAIFADTQVEPQSVYRWLDWLEKELPYPIHRVTKGNLAQVATTIRTAASGNKYTKSAIPAYSLQKDGSEGHLMRQCTSDFKIEVIQRKLRELRPNKQTQIIQWIGISHDEWLRAKPSRLSYVTNIWPLIEKKLRREDCLGWMLKHGYPRPPRSACVFCPYHSDAEWRRLKTQEPEEFDKAVAFERDYQKAMGETTLFRGVPFLHRSMKPLSEVDFTEDKSQHHFDFFGTDCEGMCGV